MGAQNTYSLQPAIGYKGQLDYKYPHGELTVKNAEASASIRVGSAVKRKAAATDDYQVTLPTAETDKVLGLVIREATYAPAWTDLDGVVNGQLDATGIVAGQWMNVATKGRMLVEVRTAAVAGQGLWVRAVSGGLPEYLGALENADDSTDMIDCTTQAKFQTSCSAGGLAWLEFDFTNI